MTGKEDISRESEASSGVLYSKFSRFYDSLFSWVTLPRQREAIKGAGIGRGARIMDLGVGTGLSLNLYPQTCRVTGIDVSEKMLAHARRRVEALRLGNVDLRCLCAEEIDGAFPAGHFDFIFAAFVISVVDDPVDVLRRMAKVGKEDCTFVLVNHFKSRNPLMAAVENVMGPLCEKIGWKNGVDMDQVVSDAGLRIVSRRKYLPTDIWTIVHAAKA